MGSEYIVTVKLPPNPNHDPHNKITGACPFSEECTDVTGAHHSFSEYQHNSNVEELRRRMEAKGFHVTRIEKY